MSRWLALVALSGCNWALHIRSFEHDAHADDGDHIVDTVLPDAAGPVHLMQIAMDGHAPCTTASATFAAPTAPGALVIVVAWWHQATGPDVTVGDSASNVWLAVDAGHTNNALAQQLFYAQGALRMTTVTVTFPSSTMCSVHALEYSGIVPSNALDATGFDVTSGTMPGVMLTTASDNELVVAAGRGGAYLLPGTSYTAEVGAGNANVDMIEDGVQQQSGAAPVDARQASPNYYVFQAATFRGFL